MNLSNINLYDTLIDNDIETHDDNNVGLEIINSMYNAMNMENICKYHDINSYKLTLPKNCLDYISIFHVNTRSLSKS